MTISLLCCSFLYLLSESPGMVRPAGAIYFYHQKSPIIHENALLVQFPAGLIFYIILPERGDCMWRQFNNNPTGRAVGDCAVRAVSVVLGVDWETAYCLMVLEGFRQKDMPSSNSVWGAVLRQHGFSRQAIPDTCPDCYTFEEFAKDNPQGIFVLGTGTHVATVRDGILMDAWDSSNEPVSFAWYRKD